MTSQYNSHKTHAAAEDRTKLCIKVRQGPNLAPTNTRKPAKSMRLNTPSTILVRNRALAASTDLNGHLLNKVLASRAHSAGGLAVRDAALNAAALGWCQVGRVRVAAVCDRAADLALFPRSLHTTVVVISSWPCFCSLIISGKHFHCQMALSSLLLESAHPSQFMTDQRLLASASTGHACTKTSG